MEWLLEWGYWGLFLGSMLAATLLPFSSDVLLVGMLAAGANPVSTVVAASLGNWVGGMITYGMGRLGRWEWIERWFRVREQTLEKQRDRISRYGSAVAFFSWLPGVGDVLALGLGFYKVDAWKSAIFMLIGKSARFVVWALVYAQWGTSVIEWVRGWFA